MSEVLTDEAFRYLIHAHEVGSIGRIAEDEPYVKAGYLEPHAAGRGVQLTQSGRDALRVRGWKG